MNLNPLHLTGDLGIQKSGDEIYCDGNLLISMDGYDELYRHFLKNPFDFRNSIQLAMRQPGIQTIWNHRRMGMIKGSLDLNDEFAWIRFLLTAHPKSSNVWNQLFWIVTFRPDQLKVDSASLEKMYKCGGKTLGNYSMWTFRLKFTKWYVSEMVRQGADTESVNDWLELEIKKVQKWCRLHPNDHSGLSFLFTLLRMYEKTDWKEHEKWIETLMILYPERPTLKSHKKEFHRFIERSRSSNQ